MLISGKKNKYSNSCDVGKKILNETKNHNPSPPFKLNGRSLRWITKYIQYSYQYIYNRYNLLHEVIFKGKNSLILQVLE
jgi:hypothetical protein